MTEEAKESRLFHFAVSGFEADEVEVVGWIIRGRNKIAFDEDRLTSLIYASAGREAITEEKTVSSELATYKMTRRVKELPDATFITAFREIVETGEKTEYMYLLVKPR